MKIRTILTGAAAAAALAVPAILAAQETGKAPPRQPSDLPAFAAPSGKAIPRGSVEVVRAAPGAEFLDASGQVVALDAQAGGTIPVAAGGVFRGPLDLAGRGGVSIHLPAGTEARVSGTASGALTFECLKGTIFARNADVTIRAAKGGVIGLHPSGRFQAIEGAGMVGRDGNWIAYSERGPMALLQQSRLTAGSSGYVSVKPAGPCVSPSR